MPGKFEYSLDYYSGAQAAMFFEDVLIDEVTSLQWTVQQNKVPIYGYASQVFDEMAKGTIIVQGSFSINFVEAGYLWATLNRLKDFKQQLLDLVNDQPPASTSNSISSYLKNIGFLNEEGSPFLHTNLNYDLSKVVNRYKEIRQHYGMPSNRDASSLLDPIREINDIVWGPEKSPENRLPEYSQEPIVAERRTDAKELNGFDIYLTFGHSGQVNQSIVKIEDVHLTGKSQTVVIDENPIQEVYSFYARNVI